MDSDRLIIEGRILELRLHVIPTIGRPQGRREFVVSVDVARAWKRTYPPTLIEDWRPHLLSDPHWERFPQFRGDSSLATPGLKPGDVVRIVARTEDNQRIVEEMAVLSPVLRRWTIPGIGEAVHRHNTVP